MTGINADVTGSDASTTHEIVNMINPATCLVSVASVKTNGHMHMAGDRLFEPPIWTG